MPILYHKSKRIFTLSTDHSTYLIALLPEGYVAHVYYGDRITGEPDDDLLDFDGTSLEHLSTHREKCNLIDRLPLEYPSGGCGDYRESCLDIQDENGCMGSEFFYRSHQIYAGKKPLEGLPASFGNEDEVTTLEITCEDPILKMQIILCYSIFEKEDVITRNVRVINCSEKDVKLEKAYSACLDVEEEGLEMITLTGSWARERQIERAAIRHGRQGVGTIRGESSHQENPFVALVTPETTQTTGKVYAMNLVYSGNFTGQVEVPHYHIAHMTMGTNAYQFLWNLKAGETFQTPEVVMVYSGEGLGKMTRSFHAFYRRHMIRSTYNHKKRPILINNWEATYFAFDDQKLLDIAREAKKDGIEMLVMDDGWFGHRNCDENSLGDWFVNEDKIRCGLKKLVEQVNEIGLEFGIWFEPEMISKESKLYEQHPDWMIRIPGRDPSQSRAQFVLDLSRKDVCDYAYECVAKILRETNIKYVKWDMNRQLADMGSAAWPKDSQKELFHRYVLGLYDMQERLVSEFPELLLENCSGGGGRFDPGMLYYSPQIWCSDDADAIERLKIQEGTALVYPLASMGAHVSDCPNHTVGRTTPFATRGHVALAGTFGYELDITRISPEDRSQIRGQVEMYHRYHDLIREGEYYRIASYRENHLYDCWACAAEDKTRVLVTYVQVLASPNAIRPKLHLQGFAADKNYRLEGTEKVYSGEMLMKAGMRMPLLKGDFQSTLLHFIAE